MKIFYELLVKISGEERSVFFGIPEKEEELNRMFMLRREVYKKNGYISSDSDKDEYDKNGKSVYFVAEVGEKTVGTVRLIRDEPLPTQRDFDFQEPEEIKVIPSNKRGELGRLVSVQYKENIYFPRHLVLLFLLTSVAKYSKENGVIGGYSFVTTKLYDKIKKLNIPFKVVDNFKQIYPKEGVLYPYFNQKDNKILPIYYKADRIQVFLDKILGNRRIFEDMGNCKFKLKNSLYNKFLKLLKII